MSGRAVEVEVLTGWAASLLPSLVIGTAVTGLAVSWGLALGGAVALGVVAFGWARVIWLNGANLL